MKKELWLIWKHPQSRRRYKIGLLTNKDNIYIFNYEKEDLKEAQDVGFEFFPGFPDINKIYESKNLFANIKTRLPNINRPDYLQILNKYNLDTNSTEFEILKATKGRLITDNYEFVPVWNENKLEFDVAGTRHSKDINKIKKNLNIKDTLLLEMEPNNKNDQYAIKVNIKKEDKIFHLGYVPRYYSKSMTDLLKKGIKYSALIESIKFETQIFDEEITASVRLIFDK